MNNIEPKNENSSNINPNIKELKALIPPKKLK